MNKDLLGAQARIDSANLLPGGDLSMAVMDDQSNLMATHFIEGLKKQPSEVRANVKPDSRTVKIRCGSGIKALPITWLWNGWLPAGKLIVLAGAAGTGKTTLALGLASTLTSGGIWPDQTPCRCKGNVLIWSSEDNPDDTLVPRLIASGADMSRCYFIEGIVENGESVPFDPAQDILDLHRAVERIGGVSLLIIDPIVSAVAGDMHRANDVRRSLQAVSSSHFKSENETCDAESTYPVLGGLALRPSNMNCMR